MAKVTRADIVAIVREVDDKTRRGDPEALRFASARRPG
jgi:hypothetical protein